MHELGADHQPPYRSIWQERQPVQALLWLPLPRAQGVSEAELRGPGPATLAAQGDVLHELHQRSGVVQGSEKIIAIQ
jgi:hypothetical protein